MDAASYAYVWTILLRGGGVLFGTDSNPESNSKQLWKTLNDRTTTIQVTLVRPGRTTVRWGHAGSSQQHQHGIQRSLRWLTTATTSCSSSWPRMCQTNLSSVSQTASRNYPSYVCTRPWGPMISRTGFSKTSPTFSLLQSQPSTTAR